MRKEIYEKNGNQESSDTLPFHWEFGKEEIKDGTKYIYSDAYGLTGTDTFLVYMEGTPVSKISEDAYSWLAMANQSDTELTMTTLVNEGQGEGIYSFERTIDSDR